jgi:putative endonuclease
MDIGKMGEQLVAEKYTQLGFNIIGSNVRLHGFRQIGEIDLIAAKDKELVFVEVKTRRSNSFGFPADAVGVLKQQKLVRAAKLYILKNPQYQDWDLRFDVAEVHIDKKENAVIILENVIEDLN